MVNASLNWASFVGIALAVSGAGLYALRSLRPRLARDHDIFFAAIALLCGGILFFQGWRLDPILQFNQFLLAGSAIFFAYESVRLRGAATEQAKRNTPIVDDDRPVSRVYRADLEELNPYEDRLPTRRLGGRRDVRSERDEFDDETRRRSSRTGEARLGTGSGDRPRKRRPRNTNGSNGSTDALDGRDDVDVWDDRPARSRGAAPSRSGNQSPASSTRPRRSRPATDDAVAPRDRRSEARGTPSSEYVDYRPVDTDEEDNWGNY